MSAWGKRTTAERVSLVASTAILLVVVGLIAAQIPGDTGPAAPTANVEDVRRVDDAFHVHVTVTNTGDESAQNVQVAAELTIGADELTGDQTVDFLSPDEEVDLTFVFDQNPAAGDLTVRVTGYAVP